MHLKITPKIDARYWSIILFASMLGTNLGDLLPDNLHLPVAISLVLLLLVFVAILAVEKLSRRGSEGFYWLAILALRALATIVADTAIDRFKIGYAPVALVLALVLAAAVAANYRNSPPRSENRPVITPAYWCMMLLAGVLGTILGDGVGHIITPAQLGVPFSALLATFALVTVLSWRAMSVWPGMKNYWVAIVIVRWWGTNLGDILRYLTTIHVSMAVTAAGMIMVGLLYLPLSEFQSADAT